MQYPVFMRIATKESFTPLYFADDSFAFDWDVNPGHKVLEHFHPGVDETFDITGGEITFVVKGVEKKSSNGQRLTIPKGVPHEIRNDSSGKSSCRVTYTSAGDQGKFFEVGLFLLRELPQSNGSMSFVFKMMYVDGLRGFFDPGNGIGQGDICRVMGAGGIVGGCCGVGKDYEAVCGKEIVVRNESMVIAFGMNEG